jgi:hypothetical protein
MKAQRSERQILETLRREFQQGKHQTTTQELPFEIQFRLGCSWGAALGHANRIRCEGAAGKRKRELHKNTVSIEQMLHLC